MVGAHSSVLQISARNECCILAAKARQQPPARQEKPQSARCERVAGANCMGVLDSPEKTPSPLDAIPLILDYLCVRYPFG